MYFTDWVQKPSRTDAKIERAYMDGTNRTTLVSMDMQWPNGLSIDPHGNKLYWCDAYMDWIRQYDLVTQKVKVRILRLNLFYPLKVKGIRFIVLYPPKCSHNLPPLAGLYTRKPLGDIPEQLTAYSALALSTAFIYATYWLLVQHLTNWATLSLYVNTAFSILTLLLLVANLPMQKDAKKCKMTETLAHGYSSESTPWELSNEYHM